MSGCFGRWPGTRRSGRCERTGPVAAQPSRAHSTHPPVGPFRCARLGAQRGATRGRLHGHRTRVGKRCADWMSLCSQNAHAQKVLVRCAHAGTTQPAAHILARPERGTTGTRLRLSPQHCTTHEPQPATQGWKVKIGRPPSLALIQIARLKVINHGWIDGDKTI